MKKFLFTCAIACMPFFAHAMSDQGKDTVEHIKGWFEKKEYERVLRCCQLAIDSDTYTNADRVHFYVLMVKTFGEKGTQDDFYLMNETNKELQNLCYMYEEAFFEYRMYYRYGY